jgi:prolyl oligopeptidase
MRLMLIALAASLVQGAALAQTAPPAAAPQAGAAAASADDPFLWLEDAESPRALDWAKAQNARSLGLLEKDPRYEGLHQAALKIVDATDRIPTPAFRAGAIFNLWQDPTHVQGLWRRTSLDSYRTSEPAWETVLDLDALSKAEGKTWVWKGAICQQPDERRCLITLSDGGEDASQVREFDQGAKAFVDGGFALPRSKQDVAWLDADTLILGRDWGPGSMTKSGYAFIIKTLARGQPLDQAKEVFRGKDTDVGVSPYGVYDGATGAREVMINRAVTFFEAETYALTPQGFARLPLPAKSTVQGLTGGRLIFTIEQDWSPAPGRSYPQGALLAGDLAELKAGGTASVQVLFAPGPRESIEQVAVAKDRVLVAAYENVMGRGLVFTPAAGGGWSRRALPLPDKAAVSLVDADDKTDRAFVQVESFLEPPTVYLIDAAADAPPQAVKSLPPRFDASKDVIEQFEATSKDGTKVPYFVVRPKGLKYDGSNPTLLYAYGGFQVSMTPNYSSTMGKLWLERGGVFVLANIRGGGEFGPAWHEAGLKTHRQRIYDDFAAVAHDLIARKITSPRRLGIEGGSNGGLLMGVELVQHPDLWNAVVIQVPLLDMLRFTQIGAGASWVGEYGSPDVPEERAFLTSISPYHNLKAGVGYPEPLFVTSTKDDRVSPAHARKMAAKMAAMGLPFLYYENIEGGHSAAANLHETAHRVSLEMTYLTRKLMD